MDTNLVTTWTPILKVLPEGERERARQLIEKYGETHPTSFIVELLELFGIHTAYLQTVPAQLVTAAAQAKAEVQQSVDLATKLHERTRLELNAAVAAITSTGDSFTKAIENAANSQVRAIQTGTTEVRMQIRQEFEKENLPALTASLEAIQEDAARTVLESERVQKEAARIQKNAEDRLLSAERRCDESVSKIEKLNWHGAWAVCSFISLAVLLIAGVWMHEYFRSRSEAILADKIAAATATIDQNRNAFEQLALANIALKVTRSSDGAGQPVPGGFALIIENALVAEMRDYGNSKAGFVFVNGPTPEDEIHRLQVDIEKLTRKTNSGRQ
jgi:hypothetical protein